MFFPVTKPSTRYDLSELIPAKNEKAAKAYNHQVLVLLWRVMTLNAAPHLPAPLGRVKRTENGKPGY